MFRLRNWGKHQGSIINHVKSMRRSRGQQDDTQLAMQRLNIASAWDQDFLERFAPKVGHRNAEAFLIRTFQYVAKNDGMQGRCLIPREEFGPLVLSRRGDPVSRKIGETVYDALLYSRIAVALESGLGDDTGDVTSDAPECGPGDLTGDAPPVRSGPVRSEPPSSGAAPGGSPPSATTGASASPPPAGRGGRMLLPADRAIFDLLASRVRTGVPPYVGKTVLVTQVNALRAAITAGDPPIAAILEFVDLHQGDSAAIAAEVATIRRNAAMAKNDRATTPPNGPA